MQHVVRQELHAALEIGREHLEQEAGTGAFHRGDVVERLAESQPTLRDGAIAEQSAHQRGEAFLSRRFLDPGNLTDAAIHRHGTADVLRLDDQPQAVRQHADIGRVNRLGRGKVRQRR